MSVTLSNLLADINDGVRNSTTGALDNNIRTRKINNVLQELRGMGDWNFTKRKKTFYYIDGVTEYSLQNYVGCTCLDVDGSTSILDFKNAYNLKPVNNSDSSLDYKESKDVDDRLRKNIRIGEYTIDDNGLLIVSYYRQTSAQLHNCDSLTANGTVAASSDATNLTIDSVTYGEGSGALNFDVSAGTSMVVSFTDIDSKDLTALQNKSHFVMDVWLPTITNFTSVELRWGSDASNYWSKTETVPAGNSSLATGKNKFAFRWGDATETGSPDVTAVDYLQVIITYGAATTDTDFRIDDIRVGEEIEMELEYYSKSMVETTAGLRQLEFNSDSVTTTDVLVGEDTARLAVVRGGMYYIIERIGGKDKRDRSDFRAVYDLKINDLMKAEGHPIRRKGKVLNFQERRKGLRRG